MNEGKLIQLLKTIKHAWIENFSYNQLETRDPRRGTLPFALCYNQPGTRDSGLLALCYSQPETPALLPPSLQAIEVF